VLTFKPRISSIVIEGRENATADVSWIKEVRVQDKDISPSPTISRLLFLPFRQ
jgi:hypothetical protein